MARDCKKCFYFKGMHPTDPNAFACDMDPTCTWLEYREKKTCKNYVTEQEWYEEP